MSDCLERKVIPIAFVTDTNFLIPTATVIFMMKENKRLDTYYEINVIVVDCEEEADALFETLRSDDCKIKVISSNLDEFEDIIQISHITKAGLLVFKIPEILEQYDKVLYLDGDILVRGDLSELYDMKLENYYLIGVADLESIHFDRKILYAGGVVMNLKKMRQNGITQKLIDTRKSLGTIGSMFQRPFNIVFNGEIKFVSGKYNCVALKVLGVEKKNYPIKKVNELYDTKYKSNKEFVDDALIVHFATNGKPWKYKYIPCADEWYGYYMRAPFDKPALKRISEFEAHIIGIKKIIKDKGVVGIIKRVRDYLLIFIGKQPPISGWG